FNLDQIHKTEDLHLGYRVYNKVGYAAEAFGSDQDRFIINGSFSDTLQYNDDVLWRHKLNWEGMWNLDTERAEDVIVSYQTRYFRQQTSHRAFFAEFNAVYSKNLNTNRQVVLGGLSGTRGFDNRFQAGDRRMVLNLEERMYTDIHFLNLIRVGWAVFIDVGRAWEPGVEDGLEDDYLADIGFGLRLASSKAEAGRIAHIDFAFPLTNKDDPDVDSPTVAVNIKSRF
ncbi:MAG: ShlB/FhaC/HecB family hemolysin secretion/activation protein, partial [Pseudomonadales bacterium]